ncbi:uncharacterized protein LOC132202463 [Neocloeon triangulifer]|uniref:uncharacterized protein LOC132202463 n=1 Tax=Neocloeon triangulifer TaxID=2078957 RepID=UPI00286F4A1A|nr:uncharacterized protein LOC132202463 [Neocloeon triangulifer]XP_059485380.1 uncharacterized protein LOC132202463 [Neocloeon triangulifer]XP_059485381.1 uncharacterized protein LOC132202463 [Neocloeon triangulifer]XP_059485382.1 uncharacterized protein LOC132202463 [Neocloeon triangulifer]
MVTLQPARAATTASDQDPLLVTTPPSGIIPDPGGGGGDGGFEEMVLVEGVIGANGGSISAKCRRGRLSLRCRSPRGPPPKSPQTQRRPSPPTLLIRSATADCMGSPPGVDTVVTITDTEQVQVALASPKQMGQLRNTPDLRVDFFSELKNLGEAEQKKHQEKVAADAAGEGEVFAENCAALSTSGGPAGLYIPAGSPCRSPSSVVVTPASGSSLELPSNSPTSMKQPLQQLPDVANQLTLQELHDFDMRYGSPHHSRSQSVKTVKRPNFLSLPQQRSRVASMPNTGNEEEYYRLRHFSITGKGVINRGDSLKSRRSRSNTSVASSNSSHTHSTEHIGAGVPNMVCLGAGSYPGSARTSAEASLASSRESSTSGVGNVPYRVIMLGSAGVGKSSLISQFMTSEYLHAYDTSLDDEFGEKAVSVLLDGEESELTFIDHPTSEMSPENCITTYEPHAYVVIYSVAERETMLAAEETLQFLWKKASVGTKAVILVGNKTDLVRSRAVTTEEGKKLATSYDCKFIETSIAINHNVDELLVGILTQIRLKLQDPERSQNLMRKRSSRRKYRGARTTASLKVKGLLGKVWCRDSKSKSCENLHVL